MTTSVRIDELVPGMILAEDIKRNGAVLLKEGLILKEETIERLHKINYFDLIKVSTTTNKIQDNKKDEEIKRVEEAFDEVANNLREMFSKMNELDESNIGGLREFACKIEEQLKNSPLALNIALNGDDGDCIYRHGVNVAVLSAIIGKWAGFEQEKIRLLLYAAMLHDFGITKLSHEFQQQPDIITYEKNTKVKDHVQIVGKAIKSFKYLNKSVVYGVLMHHERCDGSGYPLKLTGENIHDFAKIIAIADEFDVMNSNKQLMEQYGMLYALKRIKEMSLKSLDYQYSKIFLEHIATFYTGENVILSNGDVAKILQLNVENIYNPLLLKDDEFIDIKKNSEIFVKKFACN